MLNKPLKAKKVSDKTDYLKLFEATSRYVTDEVIRTNRTRVQIIRELAEEARIARVSSKQMSIGLLKPVRAAQKEIVEETLSESVTAPLGILLDELRQMRVQLDEANARLATAAVEAEKQRKNLRRIFYIVSLLWNLLYNFAQFSRLAAPELQSDQSGANSNQVQLQIEQWTTSDQNNPAQIILAREVNKRMEEPKR